MFTIRVVMHAAIVGSDSSLPLLTYRRWGKSSIPLFIPNSHANLYSYAPKDEADHCPTFAEMARVHSVYASTSRS